MGFGLTGGGAGLPFAAVLPSNVKTGGKTAGLSAGEVGLLCAAADVGLGAVLGVGAPAAESDDCSNRARREENEAGAVSSSSAIVERGEGGPRRGSARAARSGVTECVLCSCLWARAKLFARFAAGLAIAQQSTPTDTITRASALRVYAYDTVHQIMIALESRCALRPVCLSPLCDGRTRGWGSQ